MRLPLRPVHRPSISAGTRARSRGARGFSLVEVMLTMSMLLIGVTALSQSLPLVFQTAAHDVRVNVADRLARSVLEESIDAHASGTLASGAGTPERYTDKGEVSSGGAYVVTTTVTDNAVVTGGRKIDVEVSWTEATKPHAWALFTYVYDFQE